MPQTHYPGFNVLQEKEAWDPHTQAIVLARLQLPPELSFLTIEEADILAAVLRHLLYEDRAHLLNFVLAHIDAQLKSRRGESQRSTKVPPEAELVSAGLRALDASAKQTYGRGFLACNVNEQYRLLVDLQKGTLAPIPIWQELGQKQLFKKLLELAVAGYASHPQVWSEMGYAGPAYPRGYYRIELGLLDPWEPVREE